MEGHPFPDWWGVATLAVTSSTCYILNKYTPTHAPAHTYTPGPTRVSRCTLGCVPIDVRRETRWMSRPTFFFNRGCSALGLRLIKLITIVQQMILCSNFFAFFVQSAINSAGLIKLDQILYFSSFQWLFLRRKMMEKSLRATVTVSTGMEDRRVHVCVGGCRFIQPGLSGWVTAKRNGDNPRRDLEPWLNF